MSISSAIHSASSGLDTSSLRAQINATNIANASTPGYVRRSVVLQENLLSGETAGVRSSGIARSENAALTAERRATSSDLAQASVLSGTWDSIALELGNETDGIGLFHSISEFETALADAALSPGSITALNGVLNSAQTITNDLQVLSNSVTAMRQDADREIARSVNIISEALTKIEELNAKIAGSDRSSEGAAALFDERQRELDKVGEYMPITTVDRDSGTIDVLTPEGVYLLTSTSREISFSPSSNFAPDQTIESGDLSGLFVGNTEITPGAATFGATSSGLLSGLFTLRDDDLPEFNAQLDMIAEDLVSRLSDTNIDTTLAPGEEGLFIDPAGGSQTGLAGRVSVNPLADTAQGGEIWRIRDGMGATVQGPIGDASFLQRAKSAMTESVSINGNGLQGSFSSADLAAQLTSLVGQKQLNHSTTYASIETQFTVLAEAELAESGVDIDQELQDLLLIEQAYSANARVLEVAGQMLDQLMEL